jgi:acyl-CoA thioester hydrolase
MPERDLPLETQFVNDHSSQRPRKAAPQIADYPHRTTDMIRYADLDPQGHVNNAVFATYFETGRVAMFRNPDLGIGVPDGTFILVRSEIDYMRELRWPGNVEIGTAVMEFGRSSFTVGQVIFNDGACAAAGRFTMVLVDKPTRRPRPLPEDAVTRLSQWKYRGA